MKPPEIAPDRLLPYLLENSSAHVAVLAPGHYEEGWRTLLLALGGHPRVIRVVRGSSVNRYVEFDNRSSAILVRNWRGWQFDAMCLINMSWGDLSPAFKREMMPAFKTLVKETPVATFTRKIEHASSDGMTVADVQTLIDQSKQVLFPDTARVKAYGQDGKVHRLIIEEDNSDLLH